MKTIIKAFVIMMLLPLATCVGVYSCTAIHVAAIHHSLGN